MVATEKVRETEATPTGEPVINIYWEDGDAGSSADLSLIGRLRTDIAIRLLDAAIDRLVSKPYFYSEGVLSSFRVGAPVDIQQTFSRFTIKLDRSSAEVVLFGVALNGMPLNFRTSLFSESHISEGSIRSVSKTILSVLLAAVLAQGVAASEPGMAASDVITDVTNVVWETITDRDFLVEDVLIEHGFEGTVERVDGTLMINVRRREEDED